jgi:prolyl-tRNA editing enzyme YbaK/EbsC (Cys-tRNA(Pro) deacylase)
LGARGEIRTAETAAADAGEEVDQIVKSILFQGTSGRLFLFLTAGGNRVDPAKAADVQAAAGTLRHMVRIVPQSLVRATGATVAEFTE